MDNKRRLEDIQDTYKTCIVVCSQIAEHYHNGFIFLKYIDLESVFYIKEGKYKCVNIVYPNNRILFKHPYQAVWIKDEELYIVADFAEIYSTEGRPLITISVWKNFLQKLVTLISTNRLGRKPIKHLRY